MLGPVAPATRMRILKGAGQYCRRAVIFLHLTLDFIPNLNYYCTNDPTGRGKMRHHYTIPHGLRIQTVAPRPKPGTGNVNVAPSRQLGARNSRRKPGASSTIRHPAHSPRTPATFCRTLTQSGNLGQNPAAPRKTQTPTESGNLDQSRAQKARPRAKCARCHFSSAPAHKAFTTLSVQVASPLFRLPFVFPILPFPRH